MFQKTEVHVPINTNADVKSMVSNVSSETKEMSEGNQILLIDKLPSKFLFYPENFKVYIRAYKLGELLGISSSNVDLKPKVEMILSGIYTDPKIDKFSLVGDDFLYLAVMRALMTGAFDSLDFNFKCPFCEKEVSVSVPASNLQFEESEKPDHNPKIGGQELVISPPSVRRILEAKNLSLSPEKKELLEMAKYISNIPLEEAINLLFEIPLSKETMQELQDLSECIDRVDCSMKPIKVKCPSCDNQVNLSIGFEEGLTLPF